MPVLDLNELKDVSKKERKEIARKVGVLLQKETAPKDAREQALSVARLLADDASISVREALAAELKKCTFLPVDLVKLLISDIEQVSTPFILASDAIEDEFLEELIYTATDQVQEAVAQRKGLCEAVSYAICDFAGKGAVGTLLENETAAVSSRAAKRVTERFAGDQSILERLASRTDLPLDVVEKFIFKISREYGEYLSKKFNLAPDYSSYLQSMASDSVFLSTLNVSAMSEILNYFKQLHQEGSLGGNKLLSLLQNGQLRSFIAALSILSGKDHALVEASLNKGGTNALLKLLQLAKLPQSSVGVLRVVFERQFLGGR